MRKELSEILQQYGKENAAREIVPSNDNVNTETTTTSAASADTRWWGVAKQIGNVAVQVAQVSLQNLGQALASPVNPRLEASKVASIAAIKNALELLNQQAAEDLPADEKLKLVKCFKGSAQPGTEARAAFCKILEVFTAEMMKSSSEMNDYIAAISTLDQQDALTTQEFELLISSSQPQETVQRILLAREYHDIMAESDGTKFIEKVHRWVDQYIDLNDQILKNAEAAFPDLERMRLELVTQRNLQIFREQALSIKYKEPLDRNDLAQLKVSMDLFVNNDEFEELIRINEQSAEEIRGEMAGAIQELEDKVLAQELKEKSKTALALRVQSRLLLNQTDNTVFMQAVNQWDDNYSEWRRRYGDKMENDSFLELNEAVQELKVKILHEESEVLRAEAQELLSEGQQLGGQLMQFARDNNAEDTAAKVIMLRIRAYKLKCEGFFADKIENISRHESELHELISGLQEKMEFLPVDSDGYRDFLIGVMPAIHLIKECDQKNLEFNLEKLKEDELSSKRAIIRDRRNTIERLRETLDRIKKGGALIHVGKISEKDAAEMEQKIESLIIKLERNVNEAEAEFVKKFSEIMTEKVEDFSNKSDSISKRLTPEMDRASLKQVQEEWGALYEEYKKFYNGDEYKYFAENNPEKAKDCHEIFRKKIININTQLTETKSIQDFNQLKALLLHDLEHGVDLGKLKAQFRDRLISIVPEKLTAGELIKHLKLLKAEMQVAQKAELERLLEEVSRNIKGEPNLMGKGNLSLNVQLAAISREISQQSGVVISYSDWYFRLNELNNAFMQRKNEMMELNKIIEIFGLLIGSNKIPDIRALLNNMKDDIIENSVEPVAQKLEDARVSLLAELAATSLAHPINQMSEAAGAIKDRKIKSEIRVKLKTLKSELHAGTKKLEEGVVELIALKNQLNSSQTSGKHVEKSEKATRSKLAIKIQNFKKSARPGLKISTLLRFLTKANEPNKPARGFLAKRKENASEQEKGESVDSHDSKEKKR